MSNGSMLVGLLVLVLALGAGFYVLKERRAQELAVAELEAEAAVGTNAGTPKVDYTSVDALLDEAEQLAFDLFKSKRSLVRQAMLWNANNEISLVAFPEPAKPEVMLEDLRNTVKKSPPSKRVFYFFEATAASPEGGKLDVIVVEAADAKLGLFGRRIFSTDEPPELIDEQIEKLDESPLAGLLQVGP